MCDHDDRRKVGRGLCANCYTRDWYGRHPGAKSEHVRRWRNANPRCEAEGCGRDRVATHRYCNTHERRLQTGRSLDGAAVQQCKGCHRSFEALRASARYCSTLCRGRAKRERQAARGVPVRGRYTPTQTQHHNHKRRVAIYGGDAERFDPTEIYERDGWVCGICGLLVGPSTRKRDPLGPSIDHIIPITNGGGHTRANVRLTHLICNIWRGADVAA